VSAARLTMSEKLFRPFEVNALIPKLSEIVDAMIDRHQRAQTLKSQIEEERRQVQLAGGSRIDQRAWKARLEHLEGLAVEVRESIRAIEDLGGVVKDLSIGLVDFPGFIPGRRDPVNLCWKYGEDAVGFWHGFDEGYAQRKPIA
jgi:hypothetical protein